ncbi:MAG TPA: HD domain-containing phosphohydrolase [Elusimicrobiota bacterium]|jgi:HD-GYP domain-containing protein (c-di-GMP phosphodiesterase class II)|nr:HD domain-containing phosphohydrolase [Elusimicrobiota bacterium]
MGEREKEADEGLPKSRLLSYLRRTTRDLLLDNFDGLFIGGVFVAVAAGLGMSEYRLVYLNIFFIPVLMAAYLISSRAAVVGAIFAASWGVGMALIGRFDFVLADFGVSVAYLLLWGSTLILTSILVGRMSEELRSRSRTAKDSSGQVAELQNRLEETSKALETKNLTLSRVESVLYSTMDPMVAKMIIDRKLRNEKRTLTVLFADLKDFTARSEEMGPELVIEDLNRMFSAMEPIFTIYRGHFDKYIGDGLMAEFGVPYPAQNHALLSVLAAMKMQEKMRTNSFPWQMRIGIASGPSLVGLMGSENRKHFTAVGDTVNLASRLQEISPVGGMCVDQRVADAVRRWFHLRPLRTGMSEQDARQTEAQLELLEKAIQHAPTAKLYMEAANLASELGDAARAAEFLRGAQNIDPHRSPVEQAIAAAMLTGQERGYISVKGRKQRVAAFEVVKLLDPFDDSQRIPPKAADAYRAMVAKSSLPWEALLPIEALDGSIHHGKVCAALAAAVAEAMGLDDRQKRAVFLAAFVHDIGKKNVPEHLLSCEDRMEDISPVDLGIIRSHVREAKKVLEGTGIPVTPEIMEGVYQHHERLDGSGYPEGLKGEQISVAARILMVVDAYEARTSWRAYQDAWKPKAALAEIKKEVDEGRFDKAVVDAFVRVMGPVNVD